MIEYNFGKLVTSKSGHDKGKVFVIIEEDNEYVYLADGKYRTLGNLKKKNKKHIQIININNDTLTGKDRTITDEDIKRSIKLYKAGCQI